MTRPSPSTCALISLVSDVLVWLDDTPRILAVIPTLGDDLARLERCIDAVRAQTSTTRLAVAVVLNTRDDVTVGPSIASHATILRPGLNLGWGGGLQLGRLQSSTAEYLWLVQDDMTPEPGCLLALEAELQADPTLALVSPLVLDDAGLVRPASCGGVLRHSPEIDVDHWYPPHSTAVDDLCDLDDLDYVPSRGMLVDLAAWDLVGGMFPGYYPVVWADVDFCTAVRAADRGFRIARAARTRHDGHGSTPNPLGRFLFERHRDLYRSRWGPGSDAAGHERTPVPPALAALVATSAASLATDLAAQYSDLMCTRDDAVALAIGAANEIHELRASTSWRITQPVRLLGRLLRRTPPIP